MGLIKCSECGKEISDQAVLCPNCGHPMIKNAQPAMQQNNQFANSPKKKGHGCLISILVFFALIFIFTIIAVQSTGNRKNVDVPSSSASSSSETAENESSKESVEKKPDLEVLSYESTEDGYFRYVTGQIKNNTNKNYTYVQISINLYKDDTLIGSTLDNVNNLEPGGIWEFKALISDESCNKYKITDVTGF